MDNDQTPTPTEPWVTRSVWALAPALFFYELLIGIVWMLTLGLLFDPLLVMMTLLPTMAYFVYRIGIKCATEEPAKRVPRRRIWGTSVLVALIHGFFAFLLTKDELSTKAAQNPEDFKKWMDPLLTSGGFTPEELTQFSPPVFVSMMALSVALIAIFGLFLLHLISLWVGVRSVEKVRA